MSHDTSQPSDVLSDDELIRRARELSAAMHSGEIVTVERIAERLELPLDVVIALGVRRALEMQGMLN